MSSDEVRAVTTVSVRVERAGVAREWRRRASILAAVLFAFVLAPIAAPPAHAQEGHVSYSGAPIPDTGGIDPKTDERVKAVTSGLACNCGTCPHEPVSTCTCGTAARLRAEVAAFISQGKTGDEARAAMIEKHGYEIVAKPPFGGLNLIAWIGPFVLIAAVGTFLFFRLKAWTRAAAGKQPAPAAASASGEAAAGEGAPADPYLARIDAELREGGR